ncbi:hypothetical protein BCR36DRAFT_348435 [Piromyces finnis]|uniref:Uncharacterized protein n=1 Tax=Piromyces finnis TaxID=1754191 RepID=A0A1Y1VEN0_9FUNG|nr:hypothetical protein BCR36DRAFT_348435 [Piromyces finnis]|eukprot:ORX54296.1 hypothetical protein BCR36DRAFT_348435 [Piromyces finnis]
MSQPYNQRQQKQSQPKKMGGCFWCFHSADWKREEILDHSFSLINVNDYTDRSTLMHIKYLWIFFVVFRTILVYLFDLYLLYQQGGEKFFPKNFKGGKAIQVNKDCEEKLKFGGKFANLSIVCKWMENDVVEFLTNNMFWLLLFSIVIASILSYMEFKKAQRVIKSQDISFAFTNLVAYRYYCIKSYAYYCFFQLIQNHTKRSDEIAFFIFFTFKGWKRFVFADTLRRVLNLTLFINNMIALKDNSWAWKDNEKEWFKVMTSGFILFSWLMTGIKLLIAFILYIPLLSIIQGNLKEYCCHKIDKRIGEIINSKTQQKIKKIQKIEKAKIEAAKKLGVKPNQLHLDESALKKGYDIELLPDPTLPQIDVDLNDVGAVTNNGNYYNQYNNNNQYGNNPYNNQYGGQYGVNNFGEPPRTQYQGSVVAYSDYSDSLNRPNYEGSNDSGSRTGSLPYNARNGYNQTQTQQPQPQYMNSPHNNVLANGAKQSPYTNNYRGPNKGTQQWNVGSNISPPSRNQGWNDQMSNSSSNFSNGFRRNGNRPSYDAVSVSSEEPLITPPPHSSNPRPINPRSQYPSNSRPQYPSNSRQNPPNSHPMMRK